MNKRTEPARYICTECGDYYVTMTVQPERSCRCAWCIDRAHKREMDKGKRTREVLQPTSNGMRAA